jgi:integrase/recombinase XerD
MLTSAADTYLAVRRAAGFALRNQSFQLKSFAASSEARGQHYICAAVAIEWAGLGRSVLHRARRLGTLSDSPAISALRTNAMRRPRRSLAPRSRHGVSVSTFFDGALVT